MTASNSERTIKAYLDQVSSQLDDLPESERTEILDDLRAHIQESIGDPDQASEADVRNVLDRLGDPEEFARDARARASDHVALEQSAAEAGPTLHQEQRKTPGALEVAAIILTALFWPIGVLLAWMSQRWRVRDKIVATVAPFTVTILFGAIAMGGMILWGTDGTAVVSVVDQMQPAPPADSDVGSPRQISEPVSGDSFIGRTFVVVGFLGGFIAVPFISAIYLAVRLQPVAIPVSQSRYQRHRRDGVALEGPA